MKSIADEFAVADNDAATAWLREHLVPGDVVLFKASNAARLSQVASAVLADVSDVSDVPAGHAAHEATGR